MKVTAVDIGNSYTHLGVNSDGKWILRVYLPTEKDPTEWLSFFLNSKIDETIVSSVVPEVTSLWINALKRFTKNVFLLRYKTSLGVKVLYDNPESLGTDRLANALYAVKRGKNSIVVDIGTAITVDAVGDGTFYGGVIMPGITSSHKSLSKDAAQLKEFDFKYTLSRLPGRSTKECISKGVFLGTFHAIAGIAKEMALSLQWRSWKCFVTGGGSAPFFPLFDPLGWEFEPTLTLDGLLIALQGLK